MASPSFKVELLAEVEKLDAGEQRQVLEFARSLGKQRIRGTPGEEFVKLALAVNIDADDLRMITEAIEAGCEQVDPNEW